MGSGSIINQVPGSLHIVSIARLNTAEREESLLILKAA